MNHRIKKKRSKDNIHRECWNLDYSFLNWLEEHLKIYKEDASKIVNLTFHKFVYNDKEYTQIEIIDKILFLIKEAKGQNVWSTFYEKDINEILDLWKLVFPAMWW